MRYPLSSAVLETLVPRHRLRASMHGYSTVYRVKYYIYMHDTLYVLIYILDIISYPLFSFDF